MATTGVKVKEAYAGLCSQLSCHLVTVKALRVIKAACLSPFLNVGSRSRANCENGPTLRAESSSTLIS